MHKLERLKIKLEITGCAQDDLLDALLMDAGDEILAFTRRSPEQWLPAFDAAQQRLAMMAYGRLGAEGIKSRTEGEVSTAFFGTDDWPDSVVKSLRPYRLAKKL